MCAAKKNDEYRSYADFRKIKSAEDIGSCYVFFGDEDYLKEICVNELRRKLLTEDEETFNYHKFSSPTELDEISEAIESFPSFAEHSFIEVRDLDIFKLNEKNAETLIEILSDIPDYCCLVFVYSTIEFSPDKRRKKLYEALSSHAGLYEIAAQGQNMLINWIKRRFAANGQEISNEDCEYMIMLCGGLMTGLISEIEKITAYAAGKLISRSDIDAVVVPVLEAQIFKLSDMISEKKFNDAARLMSTLLQMNEEPMLLLGLIGSQCRKLYVTKLIKKRGGGVRDIMSELKLRMEYPAKLLSRNADNFSLAWCEDAVLACAETDYQMKNSPLDGETLLKSLFLRLVGER